MTEVRLCGFSDEAGKSIEEQIAELKRNGVYYTELRSVDGINVSDMSKEHILKTQEALNKAGVKVWSVGSPLGKVDINSDFNEYKKVISRVYEYAKLLDCKRIRVFSFFTKEYDDCRGEVIRRMREMVKMADDCGLTLCHENEKEIFGDVPERVEILLNEVQGLKSVYDPANYIQCGVKAERSLPLVKRADYLHIKDCLSDGTVVPAGEGEGNLCKVLQLAEGDKTLTLEPHLRVFAGYGEIDNTELKNKYTFKSGPEAFAAAVNALKAILKNQGYKEQEKVWKK